MKTSHSNPSGHPTQCEVAAVLAGGDGRRMGLDKTQMRVGSATLLERAVELAEAIADRVLVIGRTGVNGLPGQVEAHPDDCPNVGPLGGIATALRLSHPAGCLVIPCDMPLLRGELLRRLIEAHRAASPDITLVVN
ncbi:MAG: NTP transferase domain-containing protein, partial [Phycisphaerae bacterium]|nr:NTP transferase domain-containing protein [Phycisphaerae bacterium]